jgi:hypothetical protein
VSRCALQAAQDARQVMRTRGGSGQLRWFGGGFWWSGARYSGGF